MLMTTQILNPAETFGDIIVDYSYVECSSACITALAAFAAKYVGEAHMRRLLHGKVPCQCFCWQGLQSVADIWAPTMPEQHEHLASEKVARSMLLGPGLWSVLRDTL